MNCPHTANTADQQDEEMQTTIVDSQFGGFLAKAFALWQDDGTAEERAEKIAELAQTMLPNFDYEDEEDNDGPPNDGLPGPATRGNGPHTQAGTLESYIDRDGFIRLADGRLLDVRPREMSREELRRAKECLTGGYDVLENRRESEEDREIQAAIDRRVARRLMSHPSNF
jgi:hypothetical protein